MAKQLLIYTRRWDLDEISNASGIRICGLSNELERTGIDYLFAAPVRPHFIPEQRYREVECGPLTEFFIRLYLVLRRMGLRLRLLELIIDRDDGIRALARLGRNMFMLSHQEMAVPLYIHFRFRQKFIYDVHGIIHLQKEYFPNLTPRLKLYFLLNLYFIEPLVYTRAAFINVVSERMARYLSRRFKRTLEDFCVVPDGLLNEKICHGCGGIHPDTLRRTLGIRPDDQVLFFAGSFKKIGGVHLLAEVFTRLARENDRLKLILIGDGQMRDAVISILSRRGYLKEGRAVLIPSIPYQDLYVYQQLASVIVIPNLANPYIAMTRNIKVFDSLASGKPLAAASFPVLREAFPEREGWITYFRAGDKEDMARVIRRILSGRETYRPPLKARLQEWSYQSSRKKLAECYQKRGIISDDLGGK